ncbi:hypothetical protein TREES_T100001739 [Tupaia chinensis]|uniref:Uncharacterized protein n=1 Tax=Tupaia chinensis TaxID=246437 RepID=L9KP66_TUPCH|nr:hypothetical protein TREES_T100001739 [Tupaia chinensis]
MAVGSEQRRKTQQKGLDGKLKATGNSDGTRPKQRFKAKMGCVEMYTTVPTHRHNCLYCQDQQPFRLRCAKFEAHISS